MDQKQRIAVAAEAQNVTGHFGHCEAFLIFDTKNDRIVGQENLPNPGHRPGFLPNYLADHGVQVIISGGMGEGAVDIFRSRNVEVVTGASGDAAKAVELYLKGQLVSTDDVCHEHYHHEECGDK